MASPWLRLRRGCACRKAILIAPDMYGKISLRVRVGYAIYFNERHFLPFPGDLFFADTFLIAIFLETTCVESQSLPRPPTDILDRTCKLGPRTTLSGMRLR